MHEHASQLTIGLAFVLGLLHALEPGHGKTAMLAYLLNSRPSRWQPLVLGLSTALSHSISLFSLAFVVHLTQHAVTGDHHHEHRVTWIMQAVSTVLIILVGVHLLIQAARSKRGFCCGHFAQSTATGGPLPVVTASSAGTCACHSKIDKNLSSLKPRHGNYKTTAVLGLAVGLLPCPSALAAFFTGLSSGSPWAAYLIVGAFSFGIACSLACAGWSIQFFGKRVSQPVGLIARLPWAHLRACLIIAVGLFHLSCLAIA
jgi:ABC-type nickel/cobalt efflux system permease component RcnA